MSQPARDAVNGAAAAEAAASVAFAADLPLHIDTNLFHDRTLPGLQESVNDQPCTTPAEHTSGLDV